jgi:RNA recognition motif-containing protein
MGDARATRVYVGNLTDKVNKYNLEDAFNHYGELSRVWIATNPPGCASIEFVNRDEAEKACADLNGLYI